MLTSAIRFPAVLLLVLLVVENLPAADSPLGKWQTASEAFVTTRERLKGQALKLFDLAEIRARKNGDPVLVERIQRERAEFDKSGAFARHVPLPAWNRGMASAVNALKLVAQKSKVSLLKDGLDKEAELVEAKLAELLGPPPPPVPIIGGPANRFYWTTKDDKNQFRLLATGDWEEFTPGDGKKKIWKELSRNSKTVELFEPIRKFAMQFDATSAKVDFTFDGSEAPQFGLWNQGRWLSAAEAIALLDAQDDAAEATQQAAAKALK